MSCTHHHARPVFLLRIAAALWLGSLLCAAIAKADADTTPPAAIDPYRVTVLSVNLTTFNVSAGNGAVEPFAGIRIVNQLTGGSVQASADADGKFSQNVAGQRGDYLTLTVIDQSGNASPPTGIYPGAYRIKNPYRTGGQWKIGQVHFHTNVTDGVNSPRDMEAAYYDAGYDFLISTDHRGPPPEYLALHQGQTPDPSNADRGKDLLWLPATEIGTPMAHIGAWGTHYRVESDYLTDIQTAINRIRNLGGIAVINHPGNQSPPKAWDWHTEIQRTADYSLVEAFNAGREQRDARAESLTTAVDLADAYQQVWWIGVDDCHDMSDAEVFNNYATVVQMDGGVPVTETEIIRSADSGRAYIRETAAGPAVLGMEVAGNLVTITLAGGASLYNVMWRKRGNEIAEQDLNVGQLASYVVRGPEGYVRAEVVRLSDGKRAWTQPMFIGNSPDLAVAASDAALVDNDSGTVWDAGAATGTFVVDVGQVRQLNGIQVDWDGSGGRRFNYYLETSPTGAFQGEQKRVTRPTWSNADALTVDFFDEEARYVRVVVTGQSRGPAASARVREVEVFNSTPAGTDLYLDNVAGSDSNSGLVGSPWRTFAKARPLLRPRDTLHFVATATPYPPLMALGRDQSGKHAGALVRVTGDPYELTAVNAAGAGYGFQLQDTQYVELSNFDIYSATSANLRLQSVRSGTTIQRNRLHAGTGRGLLASGQFQLAYNLVYANGSDGVFLQLDGTNGRISNNVIYGNQGDGLSLHTSGDVRASVWNNIINANGQAAMRRGNYGSAFDGFNCVQGSLVGGWFRTGNVTASPQFTNPGSGDFSLQATSACIDAGLDLDQSVDFASNPIVDMPVLPNTGGAGQFSRTWVDIGAYEQQLPCCSGGGGCHRSF